MSDNTIEQQLSSWTRERFGQIFPDADLSSVRPDVVAATDEKFGDYQCNAAMALAKLLKLPPREVAQAFVTGAALPDAISRLDIAGPGFLNYHLNDAWLARRIESLHADEQIGTPGIGRGKTVVIDYSSPNIAKPMHIGHIRSTVIGNALDRMHRFLGYRVIADNHVGDWGTQFGMLLLGWKRELDRASLKADPIAEMERMYKKINADCKANPACLVEAKQELVKLQQGDDANLQIWEEMKVLSQAQFDNIYSRLDVKFDCALGESFYNPRLGGVVEELRAKGIASESDGAICVFSDGSLPPKEDPFLVNRDGEWQQNPCLIQKSDGAYNYATTDLATLAHRIETWNPGEIIYVTDGRQQLHFNQIFATFHRWRPEAHVRLVHVWFGSILGEDGKPFKTRSGDTVKLAELLDEAEERAYAIVAEKSPELAQEKKRSIAHMVGVGAIKYADLQPNRQNDYVFDWERMLALDGNTAPYLQYACARISSVEDKYAEQFPGSKLADYPIQLTESLERRLAVRITRFPDVVTRAAESCRPNALCDYLFELAQVYSAFYQNVPFLKAEEGVRESRVRLCSLVARTLRTGLGLLGIQTPERI